MDIHSAGCTIPPLHPADYVLIYNSTNHFNRRQRAFSLVELVIVVVIIGIISAIAISLPVRLTGEDRCCQSL
ncbi:hypothetical protein COB72_06335 [bacterium]|nr:MAG: hypothetical protein COB72_06335 [bacterium]